MEDRLKSFAQAFFNNELGKQGSYFWNEYSVIRDVSDFKDKTTNEEIFLEKHWNYGREAMKFSIPLDGIKLHGYRFVSPNKLEVISDVVEANLQYSKDLRDPEFFRGRLVITIGDEDEILGTYYWNRFMKEYEGHRYSVILRFDSKSSTEDFPTKLTGTDFSNSGSLTKGVRN